MSATDDLGRAAAAALALRDAGERFCGLSRELAGVAAELADAEACYRAACSCAGIRRETFSPREHAAEVLNAAMQPLRPFVRFVTQESGERSAEALAEFDAERGQGSTTGHLDGGPR